MATATAMNSVRYAFPVLTSLVDNTLTALTTITIEIPERVVEFKTITAKLTWDDIISATGGTISSRRVQLGLGGGTKTNIVNSNAISNSAENISGHWSVDFKSRFDSSWSGTSMTCEADVLIDQSTGTTLGANNVQLTLDITYEYDVSSYDVTGVEATDVLTSKSGGSPVNHGLAVGALVRMKSLTGGAGAVAGVYTVASVPTTSTFTLTGFSFTTDITAGTMILSPTRLKTARIPLNAPKGALATSKPGSPSHTIPALDTELPEASKTFVQMFIESWSNTAPNGSATNGTVSYELDSIGAHTTNTYVNTLSTDRLVRYCVPPSYFASLDTSTTHSFYMWASRASHNHPAVWMYVTYKYDEESTTSIWVDVMLLCSAESNVAGAGSSQPSSMYADLWIQEENITHKGTAFCWQVGSSSTISSLNTRLARGSYTSVTDAGSQMACGSLGMEVNNTAYTYGRGRNRLEFFIYHSGGDDSLGLTGWFHASYTCDKPSGGSHRANKTISLGRAVTGTGAFSKNGQSGGYPPCPMPEASAWFLQSFGLIVTVTSNASPPHAFFGSGVMDSGDIGYRNLGSWIRSTDSEVGYQPFVLVPGSFVWPWADFYSGAPRKLDDPSDPTASTALFVTASNGAVTTAQITFDIIHTYHTISYSADGDVYGSRGAENKITFHRGAYTDVACTGTASTDVFIAERCLRISAGDEVMVYDVTGGAGVTWGGWFTVASVNGNTFTLSGVNFTTNITSATVRMPIARSGEKIGEATRSGDGAFSFVWYDNTEPIFAVVDTDDATPRSGRSADGIAGTDTFDVILGVPLGRAA